MNELAEQGTDFLDLAPSRHKRNVGRLRRRGDQAKARKSLRRIIQRLDHDAKSLAGVQIGIERQAMRHEVAAVGRLARKAVIPHAPPGAAQVAKGRRGAGKELQVDDGIDACPPYTPQGPDRAQNRPQQTSGADGENVVRVQHVEQIENGSILLEQEEIDVAASDAVNGGADGVLGQDGRALLRHLDEQNLLWMCGRGGSSSAEAAPPESQREADRHSQPSVDSPHLADVHLSFSAWSQPAQAPFKRPGLS